MFKKIVAVLALGASSYLFASLAFSPIVTANFDTGDGIECGLAVASYCKKACDKASEEEKARCEEEGNARCKNGTLPGAPTNGGVLIPSDGGNLPSGTK